MMKITKVHDSGDVVVNPSGKEFGRSVYICYSEECLNKALKKGKINKFLKSPIDENTLEKIKTVLKSLIVLQIE